MTEGFVYLLFQTDQVGEELYKVGTTKNSIGKRLKTLQTGNPNKIQILSHYRSTVYKKIEKMMHRYYRANQTLTKNEWFKLNDQQVNSFASVCSRFEEAINLLIDVNPFYK